LNSDEHLIGFLYNPENLNILSEKVESKVIQSHTHKLG